MLKVEEGDHSMKSREILKSQLKLIIIIITTTTFKAYKSRCNRHISASVNLILQHCNVP